MGVGILNHAVREGEVQLTEKVLFDTEESEVREELGGCQREESSRWRKQKLAGAEKGV